MTQKVLLRPRKGLAVPNPRTGKSLRAEGERVELSAYWRRRLRDGEVEAGSARVEDHTSVEKPRGKKAR
jgi:hypothetical protein